MSNEFRYCNKCVMPNTKPDLFFDKEGVCDACSSAEKKQQAIDWEKRRKEFETIVKKYKGRNKGNYDCVVPVSGGKDSTYQLYLVKHVYKMNPLCVHFEPTYPSEMGRKNLANLQKLGADLISFRPSYDVYTKICKEAFKKVGDHEWPNHVGIFTVPIRIAVQLNIPLIIWGENSQLEYGGPVEAAEKNILNRHWLEEFGGLLGLRVTDLKELGLREEDILPFTYPSDKELKKVGVFSIFLGYYFKWDARRQVELDKKIGFHIKDGPVEGTYPNYENLDDEIVSIHDYFKYIKFGFGRATDHACLDIRNNRLERKDAFKLLAKYDGKLFSERVKMFCKRYDMPEKEFYEVVERFANKSIFQPDKSGKLLWKDGQLIHIKLQEELEKQGIKPEHYKDTSSIEESIEEKVKKQIEEEGYVTGLIDAKNFNNQFRNW